MNASGASDELGEFLRVRRAALTPEAAGVISYGARRVPGLRREELAQLAGVSATYYTRLEQGQATHASASVVESLARALNLNADERAHLHDLATPLPAGRRAAPKAEHARPGTVQLLEAMTNVPAVVLGRRSEVLAWNSLGHVLLAGHLALEAPTRPIDRPNLTRLLFLDAHTRDLYRDWSAEARLAVASLRFVAAQFADDPQLVRLLGELTLKSPEFARLWAKHPVQRCVSGTKQFRHPEVGNVDLHFEVMHLPGDDGHRMMTYAPAPGSADAAALHLLTALGAELSTGRPGTEVLHRLE